MYQQFGFQNRPFGSIATAASYFPASAAEAALESIRLCIDRAAGPALLIGGSGLGKSQLLTVLHQEFRPTFRVVHVQACSRMSRRHDLLQNILFELGQPYRQLSEGELRLALIDFLRPTPQCPHGILLLVDDGQTLPGRLLDELRLIHNFVRDGQPRVRLVLAGTQDLEEKLTHPQLEPLHQRVAARCYLTPFRRDEIAAYLQYQLQRAGGTGATVFQPSAIQAVLQLCEGNPRLINQVCDHALMLAEGCGSTTVAGDLIAEAYGDIQQIPVTSWGARAGSNRAETESPSIEAGESSTLLTPAVPTPVAPTQDTADANPSGPWSYIEFGALEDAPATAPPPSAESPTLAPSKPSTAEPSTANVPAVAESPRPLSINPFAEPFEIERPIPNEAKQIAAQMAVAAKTSPESLRQRVDQSSATPVGPTHLSGSSNISPLKEPWRISSPGLVYDIPPATMALRPLIEIPISERSTPSNARPIPPPMRPPLEPRAADDRDMIVVTPTAHHETEPSSPPDPLDADAATVSRGRALRVEYNELFQRLRSGRP